MRYYEAYQVNLLSDTNELNFNLYSNKLLLGYEIIIYSLVISRNLQYNISQIDFDVVFYQLS